MTNKKGDKDFRVFVKFDKEMTEPIELKALLFDKKKRLLERTFVRNEEAVFKTKVRTKDDVRLLIVPNSRGAERETDYDLLQTKYKAYKPIIRFTNDQQFEILPIPELFLPFWFTRKCRVAGNVSKFFDINGFAEKKGLCHMRVHICEVDRIQWLIPRIPDDIISRIPDLVLNPELPIPVPVLPDPPIPDPVFTNLLPTIADIDTVFSASDIPKPIAAVSAEDITSRLQNTRQSIAANTDVLSILQTRNPRLIKNTILANFELFHSIFCFVPWLWPYFYRCDELAVVYTDANGDFDTNIFYSIFGDHPDLYFWVEAFIDDQWTTVYRPSIPCHTYWQYPCGTEVNITISDPRVRWECTEELCGELVWVKTIGHGTSVSHIQQNSTTGLPIQGKLLNRQGLTDTHEPKGNYRRPFGAGLYFILQFSNELPSDKYTYYRWSYRKIKNADLSNASGTTERLGNLVQKQYSFTYVDMDGHFHFDYDKVTLGPVDVGAGIGLYKIPTASPKDTPFNVPQNDAQWDQNTRSISFDSALDGDGLYEFTLELFDSAGNKINTIPNELFQVPDYNTFVPSVNAPSVNLVNSGINTCSAFKMVMRIDNSKTTAEIAKIKVDGVEKNPTCCGFVPYKGTSDITVTFKAYHPQNFADFNFRIQKGTCNDAVQTSKTNAKGMVNGNANGYTRNIFSMYTKTFTPADLLGICTSEGKAAFAEHLYVNALATNGNHEINSYDSSALAAFALEPK
ncbi:hypothetical protein [Aquimarina sp. RZ0]|uniref:hypothetical protein n=1 Tax=Aquimarina sp. RZ0 TaxID=2607730 RepID=UPI0011F0DB38|nr:hypothetical protein [Aquimarina sp. RZ0]KAA1245999.1 hypothetical protein F0000_09805 [Aquimarina sp. RZ0]